MKVKNFIFDKQVKSTINIIQTDWGIGDVICSLYGIQAYALKYPENEIVFYIRNQFQWVELADIPQLKTMRYKEQLKISNPVFLHESNDQKHMSSPKKLFASKLNVEPVKPIIKKQILERTPIFKDKYIILSPFASRAQRSWAVKNWKLLAQMLSDIGYKVIALDGLRQEDRCKELGVEYYCGKDAAWVANVCQHSSMIISNDSGLAHIGGWLGVKTLVIMSQLLPGQLYDMTANMFVIPKEQCTGCRFSREHGYVDECETGCKVLQSAKPEEVFKEVVKCLT